MKGIDTKEIQDRLWNEEDNNLSNEQYNSMLIEQYRMYVESADRTNYRRIIINLFFLVVNLIIVGIVALAINNNLDKEANQPSIIMLGIPYFAGVVFCYAWWKTVRYFRHHVQIKNMIVPSLERRLPSKVWLTEEYVAEKRGSFRPIRMLEIYMPFVFIGIYTAFFVLVLFAFQNSGIQAIIV